MTELTFIMNVDIPDLLERVFNDVSEKHKDLIVKTLSIEMNNKCQRILDDFVDGLRHRPEIYQGYSDHHA